MRFIKRSWPSSSTSDTSHWAFLTHSPIIFLPSSAFEFSPWWFFLLPLSYKAPWFWASLLLSWKKNSEPAVEVGPDVCVDFLYMLTHDGHLLVWRQSGPRARRDYRRDQKNADTLLRRAIPSLSLLFSGLWALGAQARTRVTLKAKWRDRWWRNWGGHYFVRY